MMAKKGTNIPYEFIAAPKELGYLCEYGLFSQAQERFIWFLFNNTMPFQEYVLRVPERHNVLAEDVNISESRFCELLKQFAEWNIIKRIDKSHIAINPYISTWLVSGLEDALIFLKEKRKKFREQHKYNHYTTKRFEDAREWINECREANKIESARFLDDKPAKEIEGSTESNPSSTASNPGSMQGNPSSTERNPGSTVSNPTSHEASDDGTSQEFQERFQEHKQEPFQELSQEQQTYREPINKNYLQNVIERVVTEWGRQKPQKIKDISLYVDIVDDTAVESLFKESRSFFHFHKNLRDIFNLPSNQAKYNARRRCA